MKKLFPGNKSKALTLSYDDDTFHDYKFAEIINKYGLKCTFNLNSDCFKRDKPEEGITDRSMTSDEAVSLLADTVHEVATHGFVHPHYENLSADEAREDISKDIACLSAMFGKKINGHAYPYGTYNEDVIKILEDEGIIYARTVKSTRNFELPDRFLEWNPTCHHKDEKLFELCDEFLKYDGDEPKLFYVWGHAYEFNRDDNWELLEKFASMIGGKDDIWYCTNREFYNWMKDNI